MLGGVAGEGSSSLEKSTVMTELDNDVFPDLKVLKDNSTFYQTLVVSSRPCVPWCASLYIQYHSTTYVHEDPLSGVATGVYIHVVANKNLMMLSTAMSSGFW